ncbi:unnamed protein product, partial [Ascophyllum nodosum]
MASAHNSDAQGLRQRSTLAVSRGATASAAAIDVPPSKALLVRRTTPTPRLRFSCHRRRHRGRRAWRKTAALHRKPRNILVLDKIDDTLGKRLGHLQGYLVANVSLGAILFRAVPSVLGMAFRTWPSTSSCYVFLDCVRFKAHWPSLVNMSLCQSGGFSRVGICSRILETGSSKPNSLK